MTEEDQYHLNNIANYISEIESYVQGMDLHDFEEEEEVRVTVMENLQHIGQASSLGSDLKVRMAFLLRCQNYS